MNQRRLWIPLLVLIGSVAVIESCAGPEQAQKPTLGAPKTEPMRSFTPSFKLLESAEGPHASGKSSDEIELRVNPGSEAQALDYYQKMRTALVDFPRPTVTDSSIVDMLGYFGFPALLPEDLQALQPAALMDFAQLRQAVSNKPEFEKAYQLRPLQRGEILSTRFFAPKIINVRDPQTNGVPKDGFGWRKVLRFRSRVDSKARAAGLEDFYLLFNFASQQPRFPEGVPAGQIQALLVPTYPTGGKHNDIYFLVYQSLAAQAAPGKVGLFLVATFDLAGVVLDDKYYVPTACGQCHGTEVADQVAGKINYLDTDHWIDRTGDDFKLVKPGDVLVDGVPQAYDTIRTLNREIEKQNTAVIKGNASQFALLAVKKWLTLHGENQPDANRHVPPLRRGFAAKEGDPVWTEANKTDAALLPLLNQQCFRCHSSVRYHVFDRPEVVRRKMSIATRVTRGNMPQGRVLDEKTKAEIAGLVNSLP